MEKKTWTNGPLELLDHSFNHISENNDFDLRIAMISIDNAIELGIKTYLAKNRRTLKIPRTNYNQFRKSFPGLLDALEKYSLESISAEKLDSIEHFHGIRNSLYHEGNGITVEADVVKIYAAIAKDLINKLFNLESSRSIGAEEFYDILG
ncbi:hypothetical protein LCGC14_1158100 [marine sediment metagenome]|uniref:RiboL-PSP-HEPN domain-containing protein n=1 Tax=marine sediment metagenome TaxID=412755 RepID=A0A0F9MGI6_9ZZZZ